MGFSKSVVKDLALSTDVWVPNSALAVVIPAYNEAATIAAVADGALHMTPHVIVVDDGSQDDTAEIAQQLDVEVIRLGGNKGKAAALIAGFQHAMTLDVQGVVTLDGDGQHQWSDIVKVAEAGFLAGNRLVIGSRLHQPENFPKSRLRANRIANFWISWAAGHRVADSQSGFRYYPISLLRQIDFSSLRSGGFVFESELLIKAAHAGYSTISVPIPALYDGEIFRPSHFKPVRDITQIVVMVAWALIRRGMNPYGLYRSLKPEV
ncbi:MAG: glycosyltransferase family 2 protein [Alphaproteobacteria bacterium]|nr:glycosyltransferase family 2 protein [Alphaproteobacteria bacterium]